MSMADESSPADVTHRDALDIYLPTTWLEPLTSSNFTCTDSVDCSNHLYFLVGLDGA